MRGGTAVVVLLIAGCGRIGFDPLASTDATTTPDADTSCWPLWRSGVTLETPMLRTDINTTGNDKNPFITADTGSVYFASNRAGGQGGLDFWVAPPAQPPGTDFFLPAVPVTELSGSMDEGRLELDNTELVAVFSAVRGGGVGGNDIYIATRPDLGSSFVIDRPLTAALNTSTDEKDPHFVGGLTNRLYYTVGDDEYRVAERVGNGPFGPGQIVDLAFTVDPVIADPHPSPDERTLVFSQGTMADLDFYVATRESTSEPFTNPQPVTGLNSSRLERDISVTVDGCEVWFSRLMSNDEILRTRVIR